MTDEAGSPIAGADVHLDYRRGGEFSNQPAVCSGLGFCWIAALTNGSGDYELMFEPGVGPVFGAEGAGLIYSSREGYEHDIQVLPTGTPEIVQHLRLPRIRAIEAGQSITVTIAPDSSRCSDLEDWWNLASRCEIVSILAGDSATLTVQARAVASGSVVPIVHFATTGPYTSDESDGPGTASIGVRAGERYRVFIGSPGGVARQLEVTTALH